MTFEIAGLSAGNGTLGLCPLPGRGGSLQDNMQAIIAWAPTLVVSMTESHEMQDHGAKELPAMLAAAGIGWAHLPIRDFGGPEGETLRQWPGVSGQVQKILRGRGRVLFHCMGGCGRSGMAVLRCLSEMGEAPEAGLARLRQVRPCAVETDAQLRWASMVE